MHSVKRATSLSVTELQYFDNSGDIVSSIKKLAISVNGKPSTHKHSPVGIIDSMQGNPPQIFFSDSMKNGIIETFVKL